VKNGKGKIASICGTLSLAFAFMLAVGIALPFFTTSPQIFRSFLLWLSSHFGFSSSHSALSLVPLASLSFVWGIMFFAFRGKKPFSYVLIPLTALMFYTLLTLSHMLQGSTHPAFIQKLLFSDGSDLRSASFKVVVAFLSETALFVALTLIGDVLNQHYQKRQAFEAKLIDARNGEKVDTATLTKSELRRFNRAEKRRAKEEQQKPDEEETVVLTKKPVAKEALVQGEPEISDRVSFPKIVDVPDLETLGKKTKKKHVVEGAIDVVEIPHVGMVSIGALETIKEERNRNNGVSYLEKKQRELEEKRAQDAREQKESAPTQLSGFLQGALEAVGKAPNHDSEKKLNPSGRAKGMLAEAVAQKEEQKKHSFFHHETKDSIPETPKTETISEAQVEEPLIIKEKVLSARPVSEIVEEQGISPFAPLSTARPINGGSSEDAPVPVVEPAVDEEEELQASSGVGGLSLSALISRGKLTYHHPPESILVTYPQVGNQIDEETLERGKTLVSTLEQFSVHVELINIVRGPTVTMFEILPAPGIRVNSIVNLADNIALGLAATQVRIVAPIPGKSAVGIEIPNRKRDIIGFKEMIVSMDTKAYNIPMVLGRNLMGEPIVMDVEKAPHLLIAGSTGSGKSVCVNSMICSILFRKSPKQVRLILVDPKIVELNIYNGIPHLLTPVITDPKKTLKAFDFCLYEMDRRYRLLQGINARNITGYNEKIDESHLAREKLPFIVVVIDEFADLMHTVGKELENKVSRLAAMSRAVGIHLILATQRPSVDVITGVIKSNIPTRIAFAVTSTTDSRIIIDEGGAEKLLGKGDMLYVSSSDPAAMRIQGSYLSDNEVEQVVKFASSQGVPDFIDESFFEDDEPQGNEDYSDVSESNDDDELMERALSIVVERKCASASYLQRRLKIGYNRAARLVEQMEEMGYVGPLNGSKPRELIKYP